MSLPDKNYQSLAIHAIDELRNHRRIAFARVSNDLLIEEISENIPEFISETTEKIIGAPLSELFWEFVGAEEILSEILLGDINRFSLERINRSNGDHPVRYFDFRVVPWDRNASARGLLLIIEDVTDIGQLEQRLVQDRNELRLVGEQLTKANQELLKLNRLKSLFLSMAAHDLRSPLSAIQGYVDLVKNNLSRENAIEQNNEFLAITLSQTQRLNRLIADFLELGQIEEGKFTLRKSQFDLNELIREVIAQLSFSIGRERHEVQFDPREETIIIEADPARIQQVVYNLLSNAVKYTPPGGNIKLITGLLGDSVEIRVIDNGPGIPEDEIGQLFQIYYRSSNAVESTKVGTGLGLYIVRKLVEAHRGRVGVESHIGRGSTFIVKLPIKDNHT